MAESNSNLYENVIVELEEDIGIITLNRPMQSNSINRQLTSELWDALDRLEHNPNIKVVILTGSNQTFSAGADIKEMYEKISPFDTEPSEMWRAHLESLLKVSLKIWDLKKPVIAAVDGYALGGAADWVLSCDMAIASDTAKIGEPEIKFGAAPPTLMMPWIVGLRKAKELLFTGDIIDASEAYRIGIFNKVVPQSELLSEAIILAKKVTKVSPSALKITKATINKTFEMMNLKQSLEYNLEAGIAMFFLRKEEDFMEINRIIKEEGLKAFLKSMNS
ncbi:enoyl-CoA hydratase/isomerase family protein [Paenibacillus beijingensis]|uniref:Enoyl-CoA hydratase n=1 Tax=Paenibacillus beijingensis TaxID=1126833 RepID=A0A0D5NKI7_9BACL|nr:enoyl-CoA hydratase/isomerase family protein [Paenibacillus beijingensis]AJY75527.1 hypothetical protein VN24_14330 [Paenibacillus beijingensis]